MALTVLRQETFHQVGGQAGRYVYRGIGKFTTTATTGTIPTTLTKITHASVSIIGAPASDEVVSFNEDANVNADGYLIPASGVVNMIRTGASPTSGLKFFYELIGW